jgi:hypothetical protein
MVTVHLSRVFDCGILPHGINVFRIGKYYKANPKKRSLRLVRSVETGGFPAESGPAGRHLTNLC